jgi:hypothetical protein
MKMRLNSMKICNFQIYVLIFLLLKLLIPRPYGHLFAKVLIGEKLFIDDFKPATLVQADMFKSLIRWTYDSVNFNEKCSSKKFTFSKFFSQNENIRW